MILLLLFCLGEGVGTPPSGHSGISLHHLKFPPSIYIADKFRASCQMSVHHTCLYKHERKPDTDAHSPTPFLFLFLSFFFPEFITFFSCLSILHFSFSTSQYSLSFFLFFSIFFLIFHSSIVFLFPFSSFTLFHPAPTFKNVLSSSFSVIIVLFFILIWFIFATFYLFFFSFVFI